MEKKAQTIRTEMSRATLRGEVRNGIPEVTEVVCQALRQDEKTPIRRKCR